MKVKTAISEISTKKKTKKFNLNSINPSPIDHGGGVSKKKKRPVRKNKMLNNILKLQGRNCTENLKINSLGSVTYNSDKNNTAENKKIKKNKASYTTHTEKSGKSFHEPQDRTNIICSNEDLSKESSVKTTKPFLSKDLHEGKEQQQLKKKKKKFGSAIVQSDESNFKTDENHQVEKKKPKQFIKKKVPIKSHEEGLDKNFQLENTMEKISSNGNPHKKRHVKQITVKGSEEYEKRPRKENKLESTVDEYKPGMLSEFLQKKKYGELIIPWDPSFGLDANYKISESNQKENEKASKLKINPLFDLSKRENECSRTEEELDNPPTIFVGNLPKNATVKSVKRMFKKCGLIRQVKLRHQGSKEDAKETNARVKFNNFDSCKAALTLNGKEFEGHHLRVSLVKDKVTSNSGKSIFIGNIEFKAKDEDLWKAFEDCGEIESVRIIRHSQTGKGRGYGYVNFKSADSVDLALRLDGSSLLGRDLRVTRVSTNCKSRSNLDKVKRWKKKKSDRAGIAKPKFQPKDGEKRKQGNNQNIRSSPDLQQSDTNPPMVKKGGKRRRRSSTTRTENEIQ